MATSATFHPFPLLPKELRLAIWQYALPAPRVLALGYEYRGRDRNAPSLFFTQYSQVSLPLSLTYTNTEAYGVFARTYEPVELLHKTSPDRTRRFIRTWIDYQRDAVYMSAPVYAVLKKYFKRCPPKDVLPGDGEQEGSNAPWALKATNIALDWQVMRNRELTLGEQYATQHERERATQVLIEAMNIFPLARPLILVLSIANLSYESILDTALVPPANTILTERTATNAILPWLPDMLASMRGGNDVAGSPILCLSRSIVVS